MSVPIAAAAAGVCCATAAVLLTGSTALATQVTVAAVADNAALAAADGLFGYHPADPCVLAATVAAKNHAQLEDCFVQANQLAVVVSVSRAYGPLRLRAGARAGVTEWE